MGGARCFTRSEPARVGERLRLEAPILLVGKGAGSELRPPEIETRAALFARVAHQREIHQFVGAQAAGIGGATAPIRHDGAAPVKTEHTRDRTPALAHGQYEIGRASCWERVCKSV